MRLPGYCNRCHRVGRAVTVDPGRGMLALAIAGVAEGTCDQCADELELERIDRLPPRLRATARRGEHRPERCPVCGGLNPGDVTHTRCM